MSRKRIFIFAYYSLYDPVFQSAGLPYFEKLSPNEEFEFILLTFEQKKHALSLEEKRKIALQLKEKNIIWYNTSWHSGRFKFIKKIVSFLWGIALASFLLIRYKPRAIYAEGVLSGVFGYYLSWIFAIPLIVHSYEPHTDYMIEGDVWNKNFWGARLLKYHEHKIGMSARYILTATQHMIDKLEALHTKATVYRVPSCVDCSLFRPSETDRTSIRSHMNISDDTIVVTYLGKFGDIYMEEEIFDFFDQLYQSAAFKIHFFIITPDDHSKVKNYIRQKGMDESLFFITTLRKTEIPKYLAASDFGLVPVKQTPSRIFCSPIKDGEYWASGLPLLIFKGISDDYLIAEQQEIGIVIDNTNKEAYAQTIIRMEEWISTGKLEIIRQHCVAYAQKDRSIEHYLDLYKEIFRSC